MNKKDLPYGTQFTPNVVDLREVLKLIKENQGEQTQPFIDELVRNYFEKNESNSKRTMANNCKQSLVSYGILRSGGGIQMSEFGDRLYQVNNTQDFYDHFARHILINLNGLILLDGIRRLNREGRRVTNESIIGEMNKKGFNYRSTSNNVQSMKLWLGKSGVLNKWNIDEEKLNSLIGVPKDELDILKGLNPAQYYFVKGLCNIEVDKDYRASDVRNLVTAIYGFKFGEKAFAKQVLNPLQEKGVIEIKRTTSGRGAKSPIVRLSEESKKEVIASYLNQIENVIGKNESEIYQKSLQELRKCIDSKDTYIKGIALEALTVKIMKTVNLDFIQTRLTGGETGGAEVDILFESNDLAYSRWQVQCKNKDKVELSDIAKEVGLAQVLRTNVIVIMTTGTVTKQAREYTNKVMQSLNLSIIIIEGNDISDIIENQTKITSILNRELLIAKEIKKLKN